MPNPVAHPEHVPAHLAEEYATLRDLFDAQPTLTQRFLEAQARRLADVLTQRGRVSQVRFTLPDQVVADAQNKNALVPLPADAREQMAGGLIDRLTGGDIRDVLHDRLAELEQSPNRAVAASANLIRYATVVHMVHSMLPAGRSVTYVPAEGEETPTIPLGDELEPESAITATTDAIAEQGEGVEYNGAEYNGTAYSGAISGAEDSRGELQVPFAPAARKFYLPQWVAFDETGRLLVNSVAEAEAHIASMQRFLDILHAAVSLAPCVVAEEEYQRKRYGMLGQLINQGRWLAHYQTLDIIATIKRRAANQDLNRGLSLSLPYFDDQALEMKLHDFVIIPAGRIMFVPAFVVRATREEQAKVAQDTRLSHSTRRHLLTELEALERAFDTARSAA